VEKQAAGKEKGWKGTVKVYRRAEREGRVLTK
jgi:hypothetical protein